MKPYVTSLAIALGITAFASGSISPNKSSQNTRPSDDLRLVVTDLQTTAVVYDRKRDVLYASTPSDAAHYPNSVVTINPSTGEYGKIYPTNNHPSAMAVSGDGSHLYVGGSAGNVIPIDLNAGSLEPPIVLADGLTPQQMLAIPNTPNSWVIAMVSTNGPVSTTVYDGSVPRFKSAPLGHVMTLNSSGTRLYSYEFGKSSNAHYITADVTSSGLSNVKYMPAEMKTATNQITWASGSILDAFGNSFDPETGHARKLKLKLPAGNHIPCVGQDTNRVYFASYNQKQVLTFDLAKGRMIGKQKLDYSRGGLESITSCGLNRVAVRTFNGAPDKLTIISSLP